MAIYRSREFNRGTMFRPENQTESAESSVSIIVPSGTAVTNADVFYFAKLGENQHIQEVHCYFDAMDSNATAAIAGTLGCVPSTTTKSTAGVIAVVGYNSVFTGTVLNGNAGIKKDITRQAGGGTGDTFNINPFPVLAVKSDLVLVVTANATTPITNVERVLTVRFKYQYAHYDGKPISGVDDPRYPYAGNLTRADVPSYNYGGASDVA